jgi:recombinational DNA repair protein RecR
MPTAVAGPEIERLIQLLARLPGLGPRSARRAALHLIKKREALMTPLAGALQVAIDKIEVCGAIRRSLWWSPTSPICGRWNALMPQMDFTTCSAPRCRRSMASARRI